VGLRPETATGYDLGLAWRSADGRFSASVTGFRLDVHDQIVFTFDPVSFASRYANVDRTRSLGVEVEADASLGAGFSLHGAYAYTDAVNRTTGAWLIRIPRNQGSMVLSWEGGRLSGALTVRAEGRQADPDPDTFAPTTRPGFVTADLAGAYELKPGLKLTARVENLFDRRYQQILGYAEPGLSGYVGIRFEN
jgi:vitamin B12 transporter